MTTPHLIYFSDPMCSWCYGFSPVMEEIRREFGPALPIRVVKIGRASCRERVLASV